MTLRSIRALFRGAAFKPNPVIDPGEPCIHRQPHTPGPDPAWQLGYVSPNVPQPQHGIFADGSQGQGNLQADAGTSFPDGSGGR